jgi:acyl-homoserine-lactone acylase
VLDLGLLQTSNFTYADARGNLLYRWNARLPKRQDRTADYSLDVDPSDRTRRWNGLHRASELPRLLNPVGGYLQNANNAPWWTSLRDRLDPGGFPPYLEREPLSLRAQAILTRLEAREKWSPADVIAVKYDTRSLLAERVLPDLLAAAEGAPVLKEAAAVLAAWDRRVAADSRGAVLFLRFWELYREGRLEPFAEPWTADRPILTPRGLADPARARERLEAAAREVRAKHGRLDVAWGEVNRFRFGAIDLPGDGAPGAPLGLFRVLGFDPQPDGTRLAGHLGTPMDAPKSPMVGTGDAWVLLVQLSRPVRAWSVLAYGQSSDLASAHSRDQIRMFADHQLRPVWYTTAEIAANAERVYQPLKPAPAAPTAR